MRRRRFAKKKHGFKRRRHFKRGRKMSPYNGVVSKGFPQTMKMKLGYEFRYIQNSGAPLLNYYIRINANSLYDLEAGIGGQQPALFDNMMAIYAYYRVYGIKIKATVTQTNSASDGMEFALLYKGESTTDLSDQSTYFWSAQSTARRSAIKSTNINSNQKIVLNKYFNLRKLEKDLMTSVNYQGTAGTSPSANRLIDFVCYNPFGATNNMYFMVHFDITCYARFENGIVAEIIHAD